MVLSRIKRQHQPRRSCRSERTELIPTGMRIVGISLEARHAAQASGGVFRRCSPRAEGIFTLGPGIHGETAQKAFKRKGQSSWNKGAVSFMERGVQGIPSGQFQASALEYQSCPRLRCVPFGSILCLRDQDKVVLDFGAFPILESTPMFCLGLGLLDKTLGWSLLSPQQVDSAWIVS